MGRIAEEHHISNFDPGAFFSLHDFDDNGSWDAAEIMKFYGLEDENLKDVTEAKRHEVVDTIVAAMDQNDNGLVERDEFLSFCADGHKLPDFGMGPGHHWDMETEYEIHHVGFARSKKNSETIKLLLTCLSCSGKSKTRIWGYWIE